MMWQIASNTTLSIKHNKMMGTSLHPVLIGSFNPLITNFRKFDYEYDMYEMYRSEDIFTELTNDIYYS